MAPSTHSDAKNGAAIITLIRYKFESGAKHHDTSMVRCPLPATSIFTFVSAGLRPFFLASAG